jgi:hypothetical protein
VSPPKRVPPKKVPQSESSKVSPPKWVPQSESPYFLSEFPKQVPKASSQSESPKASPPKRVPQSESPKRVPKASSQSERINHCAHPFLEIGDMAQNMITIVWFASTAIFFISQYNLRVSKIKNHYFFVSYF